ncbi:hypothetical protein SAMN02745126_00289 [Enhydrobacter aerosaccus]|uniref:Uncharacterized protein n=1 Tax=Enhydrobacter aerosaccus TaxID=225324 RepID=A0A1T4JP47_9HYPH|nr:hypothetical protein SAMN02745126_00289 [Enhydrobacter aerosaccus]
MRAPLEGVRSLKGFNHRIWVGGAFVSNIGTWVQRTAQDWLVVTQLTRHDASAVGPVMALQRKLLIATQSAMSVLALALGFLTVSGAVQLWQWTCRARV